MKNYWLKQRTQIRTGKLVTLNIFGGSYIHGNAKFQFTKYHPSLGHYATIGMSHNTYQLPECTSTDISDIKKIAIFTKYAIISVIIESISKLNTPSESVNNSEIYYLSSPTVAYCNKSLFIFGEPYNEEIREFYKNHT